MAPNPRFLAACVQLTSRQDVEANLTTCETLCAEARRRGAELVVLPENFALMGETEEAKRAIAEPLGDGPIQRRLADLAHALRLHVIAGGLPERAPNGKLYNTLVAYGPEGRLLASYRKIHLFDVGIPGGAYARESHVVEAGQSVALLDSPFGPVGLSICYDLRFPELYRQLSARGARLFVVPAAFTLHTGKDHWHALLRARAIENQAYVLAAGQFGRHTPDRSTYGHSLIVDPWGTVIAEAPDHEGVIVAELDLAWQDAVRRELPCLEHRRL